MHMLKNAPAMLIAIAALSGIMGSTAVAQQQHGSTADRLDLRNIYLLAAAPAGLQTRQSYPAALYAMGEKHTLQPIVHFFTPGEHFSNVANDLHGTVYIAGKTGIYVLHLADAQKPVFVPVKNFDDAFCWGAVYGGGTAGVQYCPGRVVDLVAATSNPGQARLSRGRWAAFKFLQFSGENGGPFQLRPPVAGIDGEKLVMPFGTPSAPVVLAQLPPQARASLKLRRRVSILASTDQYLVIWIQPPAIGAASGTPGVRQLPGVQRPPPHQAPVGVLVLDKRTGRWQPLQLPTTVSTQTNVPVRLFGDWLVTTVMAWSPPVSGAASPNTGGLTEQKSPMYSAGTDIAAAYNRRFLHIHIPGKLALWNLADGRKLTLKTGRQDSEVLLIEGDEVLYRINNAIYSAKISGDHIGPPALVVKSPAVVNIHWAFKGHAAAGTGGR